MLAPGPDWQAWYDARSAPRPGFDPAYVAAAAALETGGEARLALWRDETGGEAAMAWVLRAIPGDSDGRDLITPFEFGALEARDRAAGGDDEGTGAAAALGDALAAWCRAEGVVSAFVRGNPLDPAMRARMVAMGFEAGRPIDHVVIDLACGQEALRAGYRPARRRQVRRGGDRHGLVLRESRDVAAMTAVYHGNLDRLSADPYYYFPASYLEAAAPHLTLLEARLPDGRLAAMHAYLRDGRDAFALLPHHVVGMEALRPNDFLYDAAFGWFAERGFRRLHLGGGRDSLVRYKQSFSGLLADYPTGRRIFLPERYAALAAARRRQGLLKERFFPLYRAPRLGLSDAA